MIPSFIEHEEETNFALDMAKRAQRRSATERANRDLNGDTTRPSKPKTVTCYREISSRTVRESADETEYELAKFLVQHLSVSENLTRCMKRATKSDVKAEHLLKAFKRNDTYETVKNADVFVHREVFRVIIEELTDEGMLADVKSNILTVLPLFVKLKGYEKQKHEKDNFSEIVNLFAGYANGKISETFEKQLKTALSKNSEEWKVPSGPTALKDALTAINRTIKQSGYTGNPLKFEPMGERVQGKESEWQYTRVNDDWQKVKEWFTNLIRFEKWGSAIKIMSEGRDAEINEIIKKIPNQNECNRKIQEFLQTEVALYETVNDMIEYTKWNAPGLFSFWKTKRNM
eukprot:Lankesteria_metandrocarpae@DN4819_c1_g1_i1.p1